jgi:anti-sigma factor RsiW
MKCEREALAGAYADRELDAAGSAELEAHLESCDSCRNSIANQRAVGTAIRERADYFSAPEGLRIAIANQIRVHGSAGLRLSTLSDQSDPKSSPPPSARRGWSEGARSKRWGQVSTLAAALVVGWLVGTWSNRSGNRIADDVVSSHVRSLMGTTHLIDVVSSDQHTVKPWFNGKLDFAPEVHDLSAQGFPLVGGRLDYIDGHPAAALVYRHKAHTINLFIWPTPHPAPPGKALSTRGYAVSCWNAGGMENCAVSDMNRSELELFAAGVRALDPHAGA